MKQKSKEYWNVEHLVVGSKVAIAYTIISECEEGKTYNENMQFAHTIIQDIYRTGTSTIEFLHWRRRSWSLSVQVGPKATSVHLVNIEESKEDEGVE
jgi:hypothetical protein